MADKKIIVVLGATGAQGGGMARLAGIPERSERRFCGAGDHARCEFRKGQRSWRAWARKSWRPTWTIWRV